MFFSAINQTTEKCYSKVKQKKFWVNYGIQTEIELVYSFEQSMTEICHNLDIRQQLSTSGLYSQIFTPAEN